MQKREINGASWGDRRELEFDEDIEILRNEITEIAGPRVLAGRIEAIEKRRAVTVRRLRARAQLHAEAHLLRGRKPGAEPSLDRPLDLWAAKLLLQVAALLDERSVEEDGGTTDAGNTVS